MGKIHRILITGANGFTGRHACRYFHKLNYEVFAAVRADKAENPSYNMIACDLLNYSVLEDHVKLIKPQYVLHLAGFSHAGEAWKNPIRALNINVMVTAHLTDVLRKHAPECRILIPGSALEYDPTSIETLSNPYSLSKTMQVLIAKSWEKLFSMDIVIAKPSNLIGPGNSDGICSVIANRIAEMEKKQKDNTLKGINLKAERDFLDVRDAVAAYEILLRKGRKGGIYEVSSGKCHSLLDIVTIYQSLSTIEFQVEKSNKSIIDSSHVNSPEKLYGLGWNPKYMIKQSLEDILNYFRTYA